jgi:hypothetical protein
MLTATFDSTEKWFNHFYPEKTIELRELMFIYQLDIMFVDTIEEGNRPTGGIYISQSRPHKVTTMIKIVGKTCWKRNFVLGHELLHFIADKHLLVSGHENEEHLVEHLFAIWADETGNDNLETAEMKLVRDLEPMCRGTVPEEPAILKPSDYFISFSPHVGAL